MMMLDGSVIISDIATLSSGDDAVLEYCSFIYRVPVQTYLYSMVSIRPPCVVLLLYDSNIVIAQDSHIIIVAICMTRYWAMAPQNPHDIHLCSCL